MCVPVQQVVVVKSEAEPSAISFMGALRIPVSAAHSSVHQSTCVTASLKFLLLCVCRELWSSLFVCCLPSWSVIPSSSGCPSTSLKQVTHTDLQPLDSSVVLYLFMWLCDAFCVYICTF